VKRLAFLAALALATTASANSTGTRWFTLPAKYRVYTHTGINGVADFNGQVLPKLQSGFARWTKAQISCTSWDSTYLGTFSSPGGRAAIVPEDRENRIIWLSGADWVYSSAILAVTVTTVSPGTGEIYDADVQFNNNQAWKVGGAGVKVDVESIATHEAGHFLGLGHTPNSAAVMYEQYIIGELKTNLSSLDVGDVCAVYPSTTPTGTQGSPCTTDGNCTGGLACRGPSGGATKICTVDCTSGAACPSGTVCADATPAGKACLVPSGAPDLCKFCSSHAECATGLCVTDNDRHTNFCTLPCETSASCGSGYECVPSAKVCAPIAACPTPQCSSNAQCPIGYTCAGGMCTATGNPGDRCEISGYCKVCSLCAGTLNEAYCRSCCGGVGQGGACNSCPAQACGSGASCAQVAQSQDQLCVPDPRALLCQTCDGNNPCQTGLTCYAGRCHLPCNAQSPGRCESCFDPNGTGGLCACPGEIAFTGQRCGVLDSGEFRGCRTGELCVGSPPYCRAPCSAAAGARCDNGEACTSVSGVFACVPSNVPGQKCSDCAGTTCDPGLICHKGRCYVPCDPAAPTCGSCLDVASGAGVCACNDQRGASGEACSASELKGCVPGARCVDGTCRFECDPSTPECPAGEVCRASGEGGLCAPAISALPDGGGGVTGPQGCGCTSGASGTFGLGLLAGLGALVARRRRAW
jgi:uncharacterized protein (TIGR03382 family)